MLSRRISALVLNCMFLLTVILSGCGDKSGTGAASFNNSPQSSGSGSVSTRAAALNSGWGSIEGTVSHKFLNNANCTNGNAVYAFEKKGTIPDDRDGIGVEPVDVVFINIDRSSRRYSYSIPHLKSGDYTLAFTCQAGDDFSDRDDTIQFMGATSVTVASGQKIIKHLFERNL